MDSRSLRVQTKIYSIEMSLLFDLAGDIYQAMQIWLADVG